MPTTAVSHLELNWQNRIVDNYLGLMHRVSQHYQLPFTDLTFANFTDLETPINWSDFDVNES